MTDTAHESGAYYWNADTDECPHGAEPNIDTDGEAWDVWSDQHPTSDDGRICLSAPAGEACLDCSAESGDMVPWADCRVREHARPKQGIVPNPGAEHQVVTVWVGSVDCLERECEEYFTDDGDDRADLDVCTHIREEQTCSCQRQDDGEYSNEPCPALVVAS